MDPGGFRAERRAAAGDHAATLRQTERPSGRWEASPAVGPADDTLDVARVGGEGDDEDARCHALWAACCARWGWDPSGLAAAALEFLVYDGLVEDEDQATRVAHDRIVAAAAPPWHRDGGGEDDVTPEAIAEVVLDVLDRWPRRGPPPVPLRRPGDVRSTGDASADAAERTEVRRRTCSRPRFAWSRNNHGPN